MAIAAEDEARLGFGNGGNLAVLAAQRYTPARVCCSLRDCCKAALSCVEHADRPCPRQSRYDAARTSTHRLIAIVYAFASR